MAFDVLFEASLRYHRCVCKTDKKKTVLINDTVCVFVSCLNQLFRFSLQFTWSVSYFVEIKAFLTVREVSVYYRSKLSESE